MSQQLWDADKEYRKITEYIQSKKIKKVFLVCGHSFSFFKISDYFQKLEKMRINIVYFTQYSANPTYESVCLGIEVFCREKCDSIIAVGGGSAIDVAKCIKLYCNMKSDKNYLMQKIIPNNLPFLAVPTTAGSGSESTRFAVIYYQGKKQSIEDKSCVPDVVIMDASSLKTLPLYQKKATMMDAFCHALESFWSVNSTDESKGYAKKAINLILTHMDGYLLNREIDNSAMLYAANWSGKAINISQTTAGHAMSYQLTSLYHIAHGHAVALCVNRLWPYMINHIEKCVDLRGKNYLIEMFSELSYAMDCDDVIAASNKFRNIINQLNFYIPAGEAKDIELLTASVNLSRLKNTPIMLTDSAIKMLYHQILTEEK